MRTFKVYYANGSGFPLRIYAERMEDDGNNFVFYIPKEYVKRTEKSREVLPLQRTGDE